MTAPTPLWLEDLHVGQTFVSGSVAITADAIKTFARQFDPQPFHLDEEAAKESLCGGLAASGWPTAALTMKLLNEGFPLAGGLVRPRGRTPGPRRTRPGDPPARPIWEVPRPLATVPAWLPPAVPRPPSFKASCWLPCETCRAGARPNRMPVATPTPATYASTR